MTERPAQFNVLAASEGNDPWSEPLISAADKEARRGQYAGLFALIDKYDLQTGDIEFESNPKDDSGDGRDPLNSEKLISECPAEVANSFSSRIRRIPLSETMAKLRSMLLKTDHVAASREPSHDERHLPIFDIDHPVLVWETSTPGHHHLIIDRPMSQRNYEKLMRVLVEVGIVQEGYQRASLKRKAAWLRMPWTRKQAT